ncbi:hypothetical protein HBH61_119720 [Parastagonospora nodorum]|nr:hypothetical protein HBH61_119720 [Parastagonospora nodorum]
MSDDDDVQLVRDNIEKLISGNNYNNLNIMVTNLTGREFSRVDIKSLTRFCTQELTPGELGSIYVLQSVDKIWADVANVFDTVVSKLDKVPTQELSSYIKTELLRDNSRKFYRLVITSKDTHCKQIIKKAYIMSLERALLILFIT